MKNKRHNVSSQLFSIEIGTSSLGINNFPQKITLIWNFYQDPYAYAHAGGGHLWSMPGKPHSTSSISISKKHAKYDSF